MSKEGLRYNLLLLRRIISFVLLVGIVTVVIYHLYHNGASLIHALSVSPERLVVLTVLNLAFIFVNGLRINVLTEVFGIHLRGAEWLGLSATNSLLNYLPAHGGTITRGAYLRQVHNLPISAFLASMTASYLISFVSMGLLGLLAMGVILISQGIFRWELTGLLLALVLGSLFLLSLQKWSGLPFERFPPYLRRVWQGWLIVQNHPRTLFYMAGLDLLGAFIYACRLFVAFYIVSSPVNFWIVLAITPLSLLSFLVSLTPGGLGIKEAVIGWTTLLFGGNAVRAVEAATIDRLLMIICLAIIAGFFSMYFPALLSTKVEAENGI